MPLCIPLKAEIRDKTPTTPIIAATASAISFFSSLIINYISQFYNEYIQYDFYLLPFRAWEILIGSIASMVLLDNNKKIKSFRQRNFLSTVGFSFIFLSIFFT